eukprot:scaffold66151_cov72-Cyclotella_meneghiniana.AAC.3
MDDKEMIYFRKKRTLQITRRIDDEIFDRGAHCKHEGFVRFGPQKLFQWGQGNYPKASDDDNIKTNIPPPTPQNDSTALP